MEVALGYTILLYVCRLSLVVGIRVQRLVGHNVVLQQGCEVLLSVLAEEEAVDLGTKLLEGKV